MRLRGGHDVYNGIIRRVFDGMPCHSIKGNPALTFEFVYEIQKCGHSDERY